MLESGVHAKSDKLSVCAFKQSVCQRKSAYVYVCDAICHRYILPLFELMLYPIYELSYQRNPMPVKHHWVKIQQCIQLQCGPNYHSHLSQAIFSVGPSSYLELITHLKWLSITGIMRIHYIYVSALYPHTHTGLSISIYLIERVPYRHLLPAQPL